MIFIKHIGIYVNDLDSMSLFYQRVFNMKCVVSKECDQGNWLDTISNECGNSIMVTKLITERGTSTGYGDMIELIQDNSIKSSRHSQFMSFAGTMHIAIAVDNIFEIVEKIKANGGDCIVDPFKRDNGRWLSFAKDVEGNWLELIE